MKSKFNFCLVVLLLVFAATEVEAKRVKGYYAFEMESVQYDTMSYKPINSVVDNQPEGCMSAVCKIGSVNYRWEMHPTHFDLIIVNGGRESMNIVWDESTLVLADGTSQKLTNRGKEYYNSDQPQPPTTISRGMIFSDVVLPRENVRSNTMMQVQPGNKTAENPHGSDNAVDQTYANVTKYSATALLGEFGKGLSDGKRIKIILTVEQEGKKREYHFNMNLKYYKRLIPLEVTSGYLFEYGSAE
ncbi:MAG: hypothetical protein SNG10_07120 [Rikenellaceae bacterium]